MNSDASHAPDRVVDEDATSRLSDHLDSVRPPVKQVAKGEAEPGEVRAFDLPLVRPQAKGAFPSSAQWIQGFQAFTTAEN